MERRFEFDSGSPGIMTPYGQWMVALDGAGRVEIAWDRSGSRTHYPPAMLAPDENGALWRLVDALDIPRLPSSTRMPVPDEGAFTFRLQNDQAALWRHDGLQDPRIAALIGALGELIARTTGVTPVLR